MRLELVQLEPKSQVEKMKNIAAWKRHNRQLVEYYLLIAPDLIQIADLK